MTGHQELIERAATAIKLGTSMGTRGNHASNIYNIAEELLNALQSLPEREKEAKPSKPGRSVFAPRGRYEPWEVGGEQTPKPEWQGAGLSGGNAIELADDELWEVATLDNAIGIIAKGAETPFCQMVGLSDQQTYDEALARAREIVDAHNAATPSPAVAPVGEIPEDVRKLAERIANEWGRDSEDVTTAQLAERAIMADRAAGATEHDLVLAASQRTRSLTFSALTMDEHIDLVRAIVQFCRASRPTAGVRVPEWRKRDPRDTGYYADTILGHAMVWTHHEAEGRWFWRFSDARSLDAVLDGLPIKGDCATEQDALDAANAFYLRVVGSALDQSPVASEPVAGEAREALLEEARINEEWAARAPDRQTHNYYRALEESQKTAAASPVSTRAEAAAPSLRRDGALEATLWDALSWLDTFSPEDVAAIETRFGLDLQSRALKAKASHTGEGR